MQLDTLKAGQIAEPECAHGQALAAALDRPGHGPICFNWGEVQSTILLAFSALPTASTCYVLAARMGYNGPYVAGLVTLSTLAGMLSLPFALGVLRS